jgi:alpha-galactosidase
MRAAGDGLMVRATLEGDRKALEQAIALDPLTAAMLTLDQVHAMVDEIFEVQRPYMPQFA